MRLLPVGVAANSPSRMVNLAQRADFGRFVLQPLHGPALAAAGMMIGSPWRK